LCSHELQPASPPATITAYSHIQAGIMTAIFIFNFCGKYNTLSISALVKNDYFFLIPFLELKRQLFNCPQWFDILTVSSMYIEMVQTSTAAKLTIQVIQRQ